MSANPGLSAICTPAGVLLPEFTQGKLCRLFWQVRREQAPVQHTSPHLHADLRQILHNYFSHPSVLSHFPLLIQGTTFQKRVWRMLQQIPCGHTTSYGALAKLLHTSSRAVGQACRRNPIVLFIPCHRVLAMDSTSGGYAGGLPCKSWLLQHESQQGANYAGGNPSNSSGRITAPWQQSLNELRFGHYLTS